MKKRLLHPADVLLVLVAAALILLGSTLAANQLLRSEVYNKSRLISMIVSQDSVGVADIAGNKRNVDMLLKFAGALTSAYINFELIPVNEVGTFAAVFESVPAGATIEKFEYHRKNLTIIGAAQSEEEYERFVQNLQETTYFESVFGHSYLSTQDDIRFQLECTSQSGAVTLDFG